MGKGKLSVQPGLLKHEKSRIVIKKKKSLKKEENKAGTWKRQTRHCGAPLDTPVVPLPTCHQRCWGQGRVLSLCIFNALSLFPLQCPRAVYCPWWCLFHQESKGSNSNQEHSKVAQVSAKVMLPCFLKAKQFYLEKEEKTFNSSSNNKNWTTHGVCLQEHIHWCLGGWLSPKWKGVIPGKLSW